MLIIPSDTIVKMTIDQERHVLRNNIRLSYKAEDNIIHTDILIGEPFKFRGLTRVILTDSTLISYYGDTASVTSVTTVKDFCSKFNIGLYYLLYL